MKNGKKKLWLILILAFLIIIGVIVFIFCNRDEEVAIIEEYTPQEEISDEQQRQTIVSIYYNNKQTNTLMPEARLIDVKALNDNPYTVLINLAINEPKNDKLESAIPEGTNLISVEVKKEVAYVNLSEEFINNNKGGAEAEAKSVYAIVNTLTELNEVNSVRILIAGEENREFNDGAINFKDNFVRIENDNEA